MSSFTVMSLHCQNALAERRSIALNILLAVQTVMAQEDVDMIAGDFYGDAHQGWINNLMVTLEEAFKRRKASCAIWPSRRSSR